MVEFALIAPVIALVLVFVTDMVGKQTIKGRLQGLAYSAVSVIKERVELYGESTEDAVNGTKMVTHTQATVIYHIVKASMERTMVGFKDEQMEYYLEQRKFDGKTNEYKTVAFNKSGIIKDINLDCEPDQKLNDMTELHINTSWNRPVSLYQVTLCYQDSNSFGDLVDADYSLVKANAIMLGR